MFLIMGMKVRLKPLDHGTFRCPHCAADRPYTRVEARRWFTVFFVPLIPLGVLGTRVRCDACGHQFEEKALAVPTAIDAATDAVGALRAVVTAIVTTTEDPAVRAAAMEAVRAAGLPGYGDTDLAWDRQSGAGDRAASAVSRVAPSLSVFDRERFLTRIARVALAGAGPSLELASYVPRVGSWLGLSPAHIDGVVAHVRAERGR